jgi:hypothetical protein
LWNSRAKDEHGRDIFIAVKDAASYITVDFYTMLNVYYTSCNLECLPFSGGWAEQPEWITRSLAILKVEQYKVDEEERERIREAEEDERKYGKR